MLPPSFKSVKLKSKIDPEELREFVCQNQWRKFCRGPDVIHNKPYPILSENEAKRDIEMANDTLNPELRCL